MLEHTILKIKADFQIGDIAAIMRYCLRMGIRISATMETSSLRLFSFNLSLPQSPGVELADGETEGVGGIVGPGNLVEVQQDLDHFLHLFLVGLAIAGDGGLGLGRTELPYDQPRLYRRQREYTPRLGHGNAVGHVLLEEQPLDSHGIRPVQFDKRGRCVVNSPQSLGEVLSRRGRNGAMGDVAQAAPAALYHAVAGGGGAGVKS